jgi:hypothetical protein
VQSGVNYFRNLSTSKIRFDNPSPIYMLDKLIDGEIEMDTFEVVDKVVDKVVYESDLAAVEGLANQIGEDVDALSAQLRALREELHKKGVVDSLFLG